MPGEAAAEAAPAPAATEAPGSGSSPGNSHENDAGGGGGGGGASRAPVVNGSNVETLGRGAGKQMAAGGDSRLLRTTLLAG
ncbi:Protein of unknown function [Gryllus bimaculatus]|nr:Protein of unknown function [Gryllus bimaculatus]